MTRPEFNLLQALENYRLSLKDKAARLDRLIATIEQTISTIQGNKMMSAEQYFDGFDESRYEEEARERWGNTPQYEESQKKWAGYSKEQKAAIKTEGERLISQMVSSNPEIPPDDPDVQAAIGDYFAYINNYFYTCDTGFLRGLADIWVADPRFGSNYERIRPGGAEFVRNAVYIYCDQNE